MDDDNDRELVRQDWLRPDGVREEWVRCPGGQGCSSPIMCGGWHISYHYGFWASLRKNWGYWLFAVLFIALMVALALWGTPLGSGDWGEEGFGY